MSEVTYQVDAATLPSGSCPSTYQELADLLASIYSVTVNTNNTGIVVSATKPADTTVVWKQLNSSGQPLRDYVFVGGLWLSRHTLEPGSIMLWGQALPNFATFDGGDANPPSVISGPMWEEVTELRAKFPIGSGTLTSGTVLAIGDSGGEEKHVLVQNELPASINLTATLPGHRTNTETLAPQWLSPAGSAYSSVTTPATEIGTFPFVNTGGGQGANNLGPFWTVAFLRRTSRQYFAVP